MCGTSLGSLSLPGSARGIATGLATILGCTRAPPLAESRYRPPVMAVYDAGAIGLDAGATSTVVDGGATRATQSEAKEATQLGTPLSLPETVDSLHALPRIAYERNGPPHGTNPWSEIAREAFRVGD